jgi:hypothetical protein
MHGIHYEFDLCQLKRVESQYSYCFYDEKDHNFQENALTIEVINRKMIGLPIKQDNLAEICEDKTDFHFNLFEIEDQKYMLDKEKKQLSCLVSLMHKLE